MVEIARLRHQRDKGPIPEVRMCKQDDNLEMHFFYQNIFLTFKFQEMQSP